MGAGIREKAGERGEGRRNTEVGKERETLRCKVRKGAGTWRERGSRSTGVWEEAESPRGRAQDCKEETGTLRLGEEAEPWGGMGQRER